MKRLLILGGMAVSCEIAEEAHKMGVEVFVTDYLPDSPAKATADKSFMVSATDVEGVVKLINEEKIDGVITGYVDILLPYYVEICKRTNLPCYATAEQIKITTDKEEFKNLCKKHSVPVVPEYSYEEVVNGKAKFPILVKPVDNSGARGIFICHSPEEFYSNYEKALNFSPSKKVLVERYMNGKEATIFYYLHEGNIYLMGIGDRHMLRFDDKLLPLPIGYTFPSVTTHSFVEKENENILDMFKSLGMKEGMVFMQSFVDNGQYIIYEMGYRLTGSLEHHLFEKAYNFNTLKALIDFSLGNNVDTKNIEHIDINNCCIANMTFITNAGYLKCYEGIEKVKNMDGVLHVFLSYKPESVISEKVVGTLAQTAVRVLLFADDNTMLLERMENIKKTIKILDDSGNNMLIENYSYYDIIQG